jgi:site-specific recombinase XerD
METAVLPLARPQVEVPAFARETVSAVSSKANPAAVYLDSLGSQTSRVTMISPLNRAARIMADMAGQPSCETDFKIWETVAWEKLTAYAVRVVMGRMDGSPATRNKALSALKGVAETAWQMNLMPTEEFQRIKSIKGDSGSRELTGRYIPTAEIANLLQTCVTDSSPAGVRDAALIAVAVVTGARRAELASLQMSQLSEKADGMMTFRVIGKRNKERFLYIGGNACRMLENWLAVRGAEAGAVFCAVNKGGRVIPSQTVSPTALDKTLRKRGNQASLAEVDWHDFRRSTTSNLLDAGADIAVVAQLLGHASVQTTARYDRRGERARIKASELVTVPYVAPAS